VTVDSASLGDIGSLATAIGLLAGGSIDTTWFSDPGGHVKQILRNQPQRDALVTFVTDALGDQAAPVTDDPGRTWVPLLKLTPGSDLFLVLEPNTRGVVVSLGARIGIQTPITADAALRIPILRVDQAGGVTFLPGSTDPNDVADATAQLEGTVTVADATLNSVGVTATVPLVASGTPAVGIAVHGLRLPGSAAALDLSLDSASAIGPELTHLLTAILQAEAASATGAAQDLLGLIGLLPSGGAIPPLPVADILTGGPQALAQWVESVTTTPAAIEAWLAHLATLVGATPNAGGPPYGIHLTAGRSELDLTVDVQPDDAGGLVITPGLALSVATASAPPLGEVRVAAEAELAHIRLGAHPGIRALPNLRLTARYGADTGTIVDVTTPAAVVKVGAVHAGIGLDDGRKPVLVLAAERVDIGPDAGHLHHHDILDLTSPDALAEVATESLDAIVTAMLAGLGPARTAIEVLLGLAPPASHAGDATWPSLSLPAFVADPIGAVGAFLRDVIAKGGSAFADLLSVGPSLLGLPGAVSGTGTLDDPWSLDLAAGATLVAWHDGDPAVLHLGARVAPAIPPLGSAGGPQLGIGLVVEGLAVTLPATGATSTPFTVSAAALPHVALDITLSGPGGQPFTFGSGYGVSFQEARLLVGWAPGGGLEVRFDLPGSTVDVGGVATPLGPISIGPGGRFTLPLDLPWGLVEQVLISALQGATLPWLQGLPDLLGMGTPVFAQAGGVTGLVRDPIRFLQTMLIAFLSSSDGERFLASLAAAIAGLTRGSAGTGLTGGLVSGSGTPDDPFAVRIGDGSAAVEATLWLDPDGPPLDLAGVVAVLEPEPLGRWLDGDTGASPLDLAAVAALLGGAASRTPALRQLLAGRDGQGGPGGPLPTALQALATRVAGGDGLLPGTAADIAGATAVPMPATAHGQLSSTVDLATVLGSAPDPATTVYVTGPLVPPWPGLDARTFDLTQPGLAANGFDVSRAANEDGPWHVRLPRRAACPGTDADAQLAAQTARLQAVVDAVASRRPAQVVLVAHGSAGQSARLLASRDPAVATLVLLGVPAAGLTLDVLDVPPAADVLQLLRRLLPDPDPGLPDDPDLATGRAVLDTLGGAFDGALAPANDFRPPATLGPRTPPTWSVRGALDTDGVTRAIAAVVRAGMAANSPDTTTGRRAPTALRGGLRMAVSSPPATAGPGAPGVALDLAATLDLGLLSLSGAALPPPALTFSATLSRPGGWLAGGPQGVPAAPDVTRTPSLRRATFSAGADLVDGGGGGVRARLVVDEVNALGLVRDRLVLGDGGEPITPEARVLLGRLATTLGPAPDGSRLKGVVALLEALGLTDPSVPAPQVGLSVDAITRLLVDPAGQLHGALASGPSRDAVAAALREAVGSSAGTGADLSLGGVTFSVDLGAPTASVHVATTGDGVALPGGLDLLLDVTVDTGGRWSGTAGLALAGPPGTAGRPSLRITHAAGLTVGLHIDGGLAGMPSDLSLWPLSSGTSVAGMLPVAVSLFAGLLARDLVEAIRAIDPAHVDPILTYLGLLTAGKVRVPAGLVSDPAGWAARTLAGSGLDPDRIAGLVDAVRDLTGQPPAAHGTLPLPFGIQLTAGAGPAGGLLVAVAVGQDAGDVHVQAEGGLAIRSGAAPVPHLSVAVGPAGSTAALHVGLDGSAISASVLLANANVIPIYPSSPGLGSLAAAASAALPLVLDQLEANGPVPVPAALTAARTVLGLGAPHFDSAQLRQLAADPAGELQRRLAAHGPAALADLLPLLQPALPAGWTVDTSDPHAVALSIGTAPTEQRVVVRYGTMPASLELDLTLALALIVAGIGFDGTLHVTVDGSGLRLVDATAGIDPAHPAALGPAELAPFLRVVAGTDAVPGPRVEAGIATTAGGHTHALLVTLLIGPPLHASAGTRTDGADDPSPDIAAIVTGFVIPLLADVALADPSVAALLTHQALTGLTVQQLLEGVLLTAGHFDPGVLDLVPAHALQRLLRLAGNIAEANPSVSIGSHLRLEVAHGSTGTIGLGVTVDPGRRVALNSGDLQLSIEVDTTWVDILGGASPGLSVLVLDKDGGGVYHLAAAPEVLVNGIGLRVSRASGPLLDTGLRIGSIALYGLLDIDHTGVTAAGGKLELADLGIAVAGAAGGDNSVAQGVLGNAASGGGSSGGDNTPLRPQFSPSLSLEKPAAGSLKWALRAGDGSGPWWIVIQRSFGPLHIEQVGFGVDQDGSTVHGLRVLLDGGLSMLGLAIDVEELSVGARWPVNQGDPPLTDPHAWSIDLAGLAVGYSGGSVSLAGALRRHGSPPDYTGVLIAHLGPYGLTAFGGYGQFLAPDGQKYTSLFVIAGITAPIGGPPAFFVTGLGGGAGINRQLVLPATLDDFPNYPLVAAIDPHSTLASDPQHALDELSAAFPPERGNFWFAAGVSFTSFALVDVTAVIAVSVGDGFQIALLGLARMGLPTPYAPIVQVELALQARFSTKEGVLIVQAQLTQNSWLLTSDCRLTGGFAYASFFGSNPNAGQSVLSIGGYHPSFHHDGYPEVPRVGYIWSIGGVLTISGQSYFALTSEAIMAGTKFTAALDLGFLWASLTLGIDVLIYFDPFKLIADGYASIAAGVTIDVDLGWFGHIRVSLSFHLGATVHIEGPDFRGSATIDLDVTSATIAFGGSNDNSTKQLGWADFSQKYLTAGGATVLSAMPQQGQLIGTPTTSAGTTPTGDADKPWKFVAEWSLSVASTAATTHLQLPAATVAYSLSQVPGIASMAVDTLKSTLVVTVAGSAGGDANPPILGPDDPGEGLRVSLVTAPLPKGVWAANPHDITVPSGDTITAGTGFVLLATATVEGATPEIPVNQIEPTKGRKPLPFLEETAARPDRLPDDTNAAGFATGQPTGSGAALAAALSFLSRGPLGAAPAPLTVAAFGRDRVAPPKLGLLTEGMVSPQTPAPALTPIVPVPPGVVDTTIHPPVPFAILDGGPVPVQRPVLRTSTVAAIGALGARNVLARAAVPALPAGAVADVQRVEAPTLAAVAALTDPAFAAVLIRQPPAAVAAGAGLRAADGGPVSLRAAAPGELRRGPALPVDERARLDGALGILAGGLTVRPGDLVLAELPNAARDLDAGRARHTVTVAGDAAVRAVALTVTGRVLLDRTGTQLAVTIPQHTARVALWCVGGDGTRPAGLAGWHDASRLPQVGARTLLAADAVVNGADHARRGPAAVSAATVAAVDAVAGPSVVITELPADTRVVVVAVEPTGGDHDLGGLTLGLAGAARATGADGAPLAPTLVTTGPRMYLLYQLAPLAGAPPAPSAAAPPGVPPAPVAVTVGTDTRWRLTGVLGGPGDVAGTAADLASRGMDVAAPLLRAPVGSALVSWTVPPEVA